MKPRIEPITDPDHPLAHNNQILCHIAGSETSFNLSIEEKPNGDLHLFFHNVSNHVFAVSKAKSGIIMVCPPESHLSFTGDWRKRAADKSRG